MGKLFHSNLQPKNVKSNIDLGGEGGGNTNYIEKTFFPIIYVKDCLKIRKKNKKRFSVVSDTKNYNWKEKATVITISWPPRPWTTGSCDYLDCPFGYKCFENYDFLTWKNNYSPVGFKKI